MGYIPCQAQKVLDSQVHRAVSHKHSEMARYVQFLQAAVVTSVGPHLLQRHSEAFRTSSFETLSFFCADACSDAGLRPDQMSWNA